LNHRDGEAEKFYRELAAGRVSVRVGMEATGYSRWFERLLAELGIEVWIGDAAEIKTKRVRKQKTDRNDAHLLLKLLLEDNFPTIWVPSAENRDLRQLLWHRHRMVQMRTRIMNQLQALAMNEGHRRKKKLWGEQGRAQLEKLPLATWASRRRQDLLQLLDRMNLIIEELTATVEQEAKRWPEALRLMTHPGVGPLTALAFVLIIQVGQADRPLRGPDPVRGLQCRPSTAGTHHQARQLSVAFLAGRSSTSSGTLGFELAASVRAPGDASAKKYCQGGDGPKTGGSAVLDVAERMGVSAVGSIRFERGTARYRTGRELERCPLEWASRSFARGSLK
jgi:Transposase